MDMGVTIVMTYFNRKKQLLNTLRSIRKYRSDVKIVIVDDASTDGDDITYLSDDKTEVVTLTNKTWMNPCIAFNTGFTYVKSDMVIIQNSECLHVGDIVSYVEGNLNKNKYLNFCAYSIGENLVNRITDGENPEEVIQPINNAVPEWGETGWYNHPLYRPKMAHFCSAITFDDLRELGGFDERFFDGLGFDDDELLTRIHKKKMQVEMVEHPFVIHQHHGLHFDGYAPTLMAINSIRWDQTVLNNEYDVKPYNNIFK